MTKKHRQKKRVEKSLKQGCAFLSPPREAILTHHWLKEPRAARIKTNRKPQKRHETACFRKSEHGQFKCWAVYHEFETPLSGVFVRRGGGDS